jgi:hypothetical protein
MKLFLIDRLSISDILAAAVCHYFWQFLEGKLFPFDYLAGVNLVRGYFIYGLSPLMASMATFALKSFPKFLCCAIIPIPFSRIIGIPDRIIPQLPPYMLA